MHLIWIFYCSYKIYSNGFESYYFVVSQRSKQPKNVQFEPIIEEEQYDLLLVALCLGRRSPLPLFFCENKDGRWSTPGRRILGEDWGGGFHQTLFHFLTTSFSTFLVCHGLAASRLWPVFGRRGEFSSGKWKFCQLNCLFSWFCCGYSQKCESTHEMSKF